VRFNLTLTITFASLFLPNTFLVAADGRTREEQPRRGRPGPAGTPYLPESTR